MERMLEAEMKHHLGYEKHAPGCTVFAHYCNQHTAQLRCWPWTCKY